MPLTEKIIFRRITPDDMELILEWANDPLVREMSFDRRTISSVEHERWFHRKQNDENCYQYIGLTEQGIPLGQIRFDLRGESWDIDYSLARNYRGRGMGKQLLTGGIQAFIDDIGSGIYLTGRVRKKNMPSIRTFEKLDFIRSNRSGLSEETNRQDLHLTFEKYYAPIKAEHGDQVKETAK